MNHVGLIGLGLMGMAIADRLLEHGYSVHLWNRTREKAQGLIDRGAIWCDNPISECDRVIISLFSSDIVAEVLESMSVGLRVGQTLIDTTTGEPEDAIRFAKRCEQMGVQYLDAPISGSSEQTRRGEAMVMVGGSDVSFHSCSDLWPILGKMVFHTGASGSAAKMKLITNLVLGLNRAALAEGLAFADSIDVAPMAALQVLQASAAYSKVMDIKGQKMISKDFTPQAKLSQHLKDVRLINRSAKESRLDLPLSFTHQELLERAEANGLGPLDNCSIIQLYGIPSRDDA
jgi:3-hydroxyisobutyrate dehydrogenase-like beta-hydroxyacid dehydrogenase